MKFFLISLLFTLNVFADVELRPVDGSHLKMNVLYTFGSHKLTAKSFTGQVKINDKKEITSGEIHLLVTDVKGEKPTLICHLQESLTLNYDVSDFPESHVCEDDKLPVEGKNSPVFKTITARLARPTAINSKILPLIWEIHGVKKEIQVPVEMSLAEKQGLLEINSQFNLKRSDFNIIVKKFAFVGADDELPITLNLKLGKSF